MEQTGIRVFRKDGLPTVRIGGEVAAHIFDGGLHGGLGASAFIVDLADVGTGPPVHTHPYAEIFIVLEGAVRLVAGDRAVDATPDEVCVVDAGVPHSFTNAGPGRARLVNVHAASTVVTEFVRDTPTDGSYDYNHTG
ncbi:cupin domain-containing protein [Actinosynnema sp. NPDC091369]